MNVNKGKIDTILKIFKDFKADDEEVPSNPSKNSKLMNELLEQLIAKETVKYIQKSKCWSEDENHLQTEKHLSFLKRIQIILEWTRTLSNDDDWDSTILTALLCSIDHLRQWNRSLHELPRKITRFLINDHHHQYHHNDHHHHHNVNDDDKEKRLIHRLLKEFQNIEDLQKLERIFQLINDEELQGFLKERMSEELSKLISELQNVQELLKCNGKSHLGMRVRGNFQWDDKNQRKFQVNFLWKLKCFGFSSSSFLN